MSLFLPVFCDGLLSAFKELSRLPAVFLRGIIQPRYEILGAVLFGLPMIFNVINLVFKVITASSFNGRRRRRFSGENRSGEGWYSLRYSRLTTGCALMLVGRSSLYAVELIL